MIKSKVYIAGAGPGDPGLITVKLQSVLKTADCVLYDYLVNKTLLGCCKESAELIPVGKSGKADSSHKFAQDDIHTLLVARAKKSLTVLRLKGGDPFIFGRGSEECEALAEEGINFEIIPGISSTIAGPAYAGIPLTHRGLSRSVAIATGHLQKGEDADNIQIPSADTIVFVMGIKNLSVLVDKLYVSGYSTNTKCALIENACSPIQRTFLTTLEDVVKVRDDNNVTPPALFVIGDVTDLRQQLAWYEKKPLFGKKILVTRTHKQAQITVETLRDLGAIVIEYPVIEIVPIKGISTILSQDGYLETFTDIIFTSVNGVEIFFDSLFTGNDDARAFSGKTISAIGKMTANKLLEYGIKADLIPDTYQAEGILEKLETDLTGRKFLLPRAKNARKLLISEIEARNGEIEELHLYEAKAPCGLSSINNDITLDGICFTSTSTVVNFCKVNPGYRDIPVFAIGDITTESARQEGFTNIHVSKEATIDSLVDKCIEVLK
jgi:uroporphyrinogen III methyltransferase / synthase